MMNIDGQMCFLDPPEQENLRTWHKLQDPDAWAHMDAYDVEELPDGSEVIVAEIPHDYTTGKPKLEEARYCRVILRRYPGRYTAAIRLYVTPTPEWPARPKWQSWGDGEQWGYIDHGYRYRYFIRKEVQVDAAD